MPYIELLKRTKISLCSKRAKKKKCSLQVQCRDAFNVIVIIADETGNQSSNPG